MSSGELTAVERARAAALSALSPVTNVDGARLDQLFTLTLVLSTGWVVVRTLTADWGSQTKLTPLVVGIPTLALLLALLAVQSSERVAAVAGGFAAGDVLGVEDRVAEMQTRTEESTEGAGEDLDGREAVLAMCFWVLLLFGLVLVIGFTVGIPAFLLAFYRARTGMSWPRTLALTAFIWAFVAVIFIYVLNAPLYPGLLGIEVPYLN
jgi:hypothetical protein